MAAPVQAPTLGNDHGLQHTDPIGQYGSEWVSHNCLTTHNQCAHTTIPINRCRGSHLGVMGHSISSFGMVNGAGMGGTIAILPLPTAARAPIARNGLGAAAAASSSTSRGPFQPHVAA